MRALIPPCVASENQAFNSPLTITPDEENTGRGCQIVASSNCNFLGKNNNSPNSVECNQTVFKCSYAKSCERRCSFQQKLQVFLSEAVFLLTRPATRQNRASYQVFTQVKWDGFK